MADELYVPFAGLRRNARALFAGGLLLVALWLLPDLMPAPTGPSTIELAHGRIEALLPDADEGAPNVRVAILDGPRAGTTLDGYVEGPSGAGDLPAYSPGDEVIVTISPGEPVALVAVSDRWRAPALAAILGLFAAAVTLVGGWRGVRSLIALALTLVVVVRIVVPLLLAGWSPVLVAVAAGSLVTLATILLTEGARATTFAAVAGTFAALVLTALLALAGNALAAFTTLQGQEAASFLQSTGRGGLDIGGLLLAGVIFGALGVLDDVTVTQAATVEELAAADPSASPARLFERGMNVGRSHIAATVNTLVLAYVGASLPLLVLFAAGRQDPLLIASGENVAVEIVRSLVGSIGIVAAVPFTTAVAALVARRTVTGRTL
ncbi:MAG TPA: YibE/F family protein [Candidatus Limnocylindrales bacterium]|nr:YibE/F family protein [Candidatus Limnocylindrales bacterium]